MSSRLDRLLLLLDTGSSTLVRNTAAKQLAQLAAKSVNGDAAIEEEVKVSRHHASRGDASSWRELMSVVARILPFLHSKSFETRTAASVALSHIFSLVPLWEPCGDIKPDVDMDQPVVVPDYPSFSVQELMQKGTLLLASSGKEFIKPSGILASADAVQKARQEAMGRLGLEFLDDDDMDLGKELADSGTMEVDSSAVKTEEEIVPSSPITVEPPPIVEEKPAKRTRAPPKNRLEPVVAPAPSTSSGAPSPTGESNDDLSALSARERNRLKRKRKPGNSAFVNAPPSQTTGSKYSATPAPNSSKARLVAADETGTSSSRTRSDSPASNGHPNGNGVSSENKVIIDPSKGGAVDPKAAQQQSSKALDVAAGVWVWDGVVKMLEVELFSAAWEARHGAAMALRELLKVQGKSGGMHDDSSDAANALAHERWCNDLSAKFLCVFVLDRFGDFVSDQVVAPVRETVSQTLASLLIHMPRRSVSHVHSILLQMIRQDFTLTNGSSTNGVSKLSLPGKRSRDKGPEQGHVWEVRHAGLLGIKYEVAVRSDLFEVDPVKQESGGDFDDMGKDVLSGLVDAAVLGLGDRDDDVRAVAASCLLPVAGHLVKQQPGSLERVLVVLWSCLGNMKDDLSSSVGAVMDLLGKLVSYDAVIDILANRDLSLPLTSLAPTLFPFFRHTIANVRLAVVTTLHSFMTVASLSRDWIAAPFLRLLLQNLVCEERSDIRDGSLVAWREALVILSSKPGWMESIVTQALILEWYAMVMTPLGTRVESSCFYRPCVDDDGFDAAPERHNVDKNMLEQDFTLISPEVTMKARVAASTALAHLIAYWPTVSGVIQSEAIFEPMLAHYIDSTSMLQKLLTAVICEEWARTRDELTPPATIVPLIQQSPLALHVSNKTLAFLQSEPPTVYHEMAGGLFAIFTDCTNLLRSFAHDCKLPISSIPYLGTEIDMVGEPNTDKFTIEKAQTAMGAQYKALEKTLGRTKKKELAAMAERRLKTLASIERYIETKTQHDVRVSAAFAAAFVALRNAPGKVSPVVKGVMNGIKNEENLDLQTRSAIAVASFVEFCVQNSLPQPPDKIVKNLCTFLCQDTETTPTFAFARKVTDGILSFQSTVPPALAAGAKGKDAPSKAETVKAGGFAKSRLSRRGAGLAFVKLSAKFGPKLLETVPNMWQSMVGGLLSTCTATSPAEMDQLIEEAGQDVIDSLSVLEAVIPTLHPDLWPKLVDIYPMMTLALQSRFAIVRQAAARCFAIVCDVMTSEAMQYVIKHVVPLLGDALALSNRQGATELIYHIVQRLDIKALPYVIFMVVPVLGRMSDSDDDIRSTATNTFASLVKMVPLEAGLPDPRGFPEELLKRRDTERQFLSQLLDGNKVQEYTIPIPIKAELRKYQQEGVNWLAFLAKYQLHGILCDDMGLGKTLQSICILSSKHFERAERYKELNTPDSVHLPSLIICPPTLTGHWYYELLKYAVNLRPVLYTGNARERARLLTKLNQFDVIITSYEVVRNDIATLGDIRFLYCILDEGHVIKNAKTKLTKAVKCIQAQHRLLLSGTPIQNNVLELWSLFDFLMPGFLGTESSFNDRFGKPILSNRDGKTKNGEAAALALEALHKQVLPFLLRRLKEDVLHDLPPKIIQDYYCELSDLQKYLYDDFSKSTMRTSAQDVVKSEGKGETQHVFQSLQYLRKLCNHPALVLKNEPEAAAAALEKIGGQSDGLDDIVHAPKLLALRQLLTECGIGSSASSPGEAKADTDVLTDSTDAAFSQHRVLIFCQMKQMIDIIEKDLFKKHMPSVTYMRLDGNTDASKRHDVVQTFNADPSIDCLLLTTHVGGLGLTLTGADTVIFVEHDWNPSKDVQAMDRAHRIGQKKVVNVYRLITKGTLEEKIMGLQRFKLNIANSVITQQNSGLESMDTDRVLDLFKRTTDEEDSAAQKKAAADASGPTTQQNVLQGLEDLPAEDEYEGMDLSSFMGSLGR